MLKNKNHLMDLLVMADSLNDKIIQILKLFL